MSATLRDHLRSIYDNRGVLTPQVVVDEARPPTSPLHARFEWDDAIAGEAYRRSQAAELIRSVKVAYAEGPEGPRHVRAWLPTREPESPTSAYAPTDELMGDEFSRKLILRQAMRDWDTYYKRYGALEEFGRIVSGEITVSDVG